MTRLDEQIKREFKRRVGRLNEATSLPKNLKWEKDDYAVEHDMEAKEDSRNMVIFAETQDEIITCYFGRSESGKDWFVTIEDDMGEMYFNKKFKDYTSAQKQITKLTGWKNFN